MSRGGARITGGSTFTTAHLTENSADLGFAPGQTLNGTISFETPFGNSSYVGLNGSDGDFTVGSSGVILTNAGYEGGGVIGNSGRYGGAMTLINQGLISSRTSGATLTIDASSLTSSGTLQAINGGTLNVSPTGFATNNGVIDVQDGSTIYVSSGALTNFSGGTLTSGTYCLTSTGNPTTLSLGGDGITTNAASVSLSGSDTIFTEINSLASNHGRFAISNDRNFTTVGALANSGTLVAGAGSTFTVNGALIQPSTGTLAGTGTFSATAFTLAGTILSAAGEGTLTLNGTTVFEPGLALAYVLGSLSGTNDHLDVVGDFTLAGTLDITALDGFGAGTYDLIDYSGGTFTDETLGIGTTPGGFNYQIVTTTPGQVDLTVTNAVPEPATWEMMAAGAGTLLFFGHRKKLKF